MNFFIESVILWPRNDQLDPQIVSFENNKVNIITGDSRTGKSALIPIIDYCFCSDNCNIPVDTIRDYCEWYGVLFACSTEKFLICRRNPEEQHSTSDAFYLRDTSIKIPRSIQKNTSTRLIKQELNQLFQIADCPIYESGEFDSHRPSYRDIAAFLFQPQNIIANPEALFYKLDETKHRLKLISIFPYLFGALTEEGLLAEAELRELTQQKKKRETDLASLRNVALRWKNEISVWLLKAAEYGLTDHRVVDEADFDKQLTEMRFVINAPRKTFALSNQGIEMASEEIASFEKREEEISSEIANIRSRLAKINTVSTSLDDYANSVDAQKQYLSITQWLVNNQNKTLCPICGNAFHASSEALDTLLRREEALNDEANNAPLRDKLLKQKVELNNSLRQKTEELKAITLGLKKLEEQDNERRKRIYTTEEINRFLGKMEAAYEQLSSISSDKKLEEEIVTLDKRIKSLNTIVNKEEKQAKTNLATGKISQSTQAILATLDVEHPEWQVRFECSNLALRIIDGHGQYRYLNQVGSASNWLSYHIALSLAFQEFFQVQTFVEVPSFLFFDQPSQVYFPHEIDDDKDRDKASVKKIFSAFNAYVERPEFDSQIIVTEHAGRDIWGHIESKHIAATWKEGGEKLIPKHWIDEDKTFVG